MKRRDFLRLSGTFLVAAKLGGCGGDDTGGDVDAGVDGGPDAPQTGVVEFPQGVASGDPGPASIVLWTRAVRSDGTAADTQIKVDVATDMSFTNIVATRMVSAAAAVDHTVRVIVTDLAANTTYYYRFSAGLDQIVGRTRTAPAPDADVPVRIAWASCQDYGAGHYGAYRLMLQEDMARPENDQVQFVLFLGDFIYETRGGQFQVPLDDNLEPIILNNPDGTPRQIGPFPSGGGSAGGANFANTVADYRHLYRSFASDPDLKAARARWPFIHTWDDHEFTNDCWQSMANYTDGDTIDEASQSRKIAANQAWFEYIPCQLTGARGPAGVTQNARDFEPAAVNDAAFTTPNEFNFVDEANNAAAVGSMTIYRSLRWGRHVELVLTDQRSYRSDHAIPEEFAIGNNGYLDTRNVLPAGDLAVMDAGRTYNGGNPPATVPDAGFTNTRATSPPGTMLGREQKDWFKDTMRLSDATWKIWGNEVPLMRFFIRRDPVQNLIFDRIMNGDAWDGYATERAELMTYLRTENINNVVVLTGDIHAHFAGLVMDDFLAPTPTPVAVEFAAAGIASNSVFSFFESAARGAIVPPPVRGLVTYDASGGGGPPFQENLNLLLLHGTASANTMANTNDLETALTASNPDNPHLKYADTNAQGFGVALVTATQVEATLTTVERPVTAAAPAVKRTARFTVPAGNPGGLVGPSFTGTPPFPFVPG